MLYNKLFRDNDLCDYILNRSSDKSEYPAIRVKRTCATTDEYGTMTYSIAFPGAVRSDFKVYYNKIGQVKVISNARNSFIKPITFQFQCAYEDYKFDTYDCVNGILTITFKEEKPEEPEDDPFIEA